MRFDNPLRQLYCTVAVLAAVALAAPVTLGGAEIAATHLVYEKPVKMRKIDARQYLSFVDQALKSDSPDRPRRVDCAVAATGAKGPLAATGRLELRLLGESTDTAATWRSSALSATLDGNGNAQFGEADILGLVAEAQAEGVDIELFELDYAGGKGKKVTTLTVDCLREPAEQ